jgi:hypothetical protein
MIYFYGKKTMKRNNLYYWTVTSLFCAFMLFSSIPDIAMNPEAINFLTHLGYPLYFVPFIGVAKVAGCIAILTPGLVRLKEWAYAGMFFDLFGAAYSVICTDGFEAGVFFILLPIGFLFLSYFMWHKRRSRASSVSAEIAQA